MLQAGLLAGSTLAVIGYDVHSLRSRLADLRSERARILQRTAEREAREERARTDRELLRQLEVTESRLARWDEERFLIPELLRAIAAVVPETVILEVVRREGSALRVSGRARSAAVVARALDALSGMERVRELELLWVERTAGAADPDEQRFAFAGSLRYASREPESFERVEPAPRAGEGFR
jgi:Tfp pilus assembly protein PilN